MCNIDAKGKFVRLAGGLISVFLGIILSVLLVLNDLPSNLLTVASILGLFSGGVLGIYEGRSGWCFARALGIWTPI